jgi:PTH1 family peptidyl-tRNA hydrolase
VWIVGLGNPGGRYAATRHNVGMEVALRLVDRWRAHLFERGSAFESYRAEVESPGSARDVVLVLPLAYMNRSGEALRALADRTGEAARPSETLVVTDDLYLPVGTIRLRGRGSTGGHRGLESIEAYFGGAEYARLRIGVGEAPGETRRDHVLSGFAPEEEDAVEGALRRAVEACETWVREGLIAAMNQFNRKTSEVSS